LLLNFDYDGVFVDSLDDLLDKACQAQKIIGYGRKPEKKDFQTIKDLTFEQLAHTIGIPDEKLYDFGLKLFELQASDKGICKLFDGISEVIPQLSVKHTIIIITSSITQAVERVLGHYNLLEYISFIFDGTQGGSKSEKIAQARETFSTDLNETFMIGDCVSDIRQGKIACVRTVAVTWGYQSKEFLLAEEPDYVVEKPRQLLELFE
jgi:phosphoglycolate phosphatase-like HAD superfamily hydrolase